MAPMWNSTMAVLPYTQGQFKFPGPRIVQVRSGSDSSRILRFFEYPGLFLRAANRDDSRSGELDAAR